MNATEHNVDGSDSERTEGDQSVLTTSSEPLAARTADPGKPSRNRVLIVEDNADSRVTLEQLLRLDGFEVVSAPDGVTGLDAIRREHPDVALLDISLPGMSGDEIARRVRAESDDRAIRLVALTGYSHAEDYAALLAAGFDEHLVKPVSRDDLLRVLRK